MKNCKTCQFWGEDLNQDYELKHKECCNPKIGNDLDDDSLGHNYEYGYSVTTGPDFGCVHWKKKLC